MPDVDFDDEIGRWIAFEINPRLAAHCGPNPGIPVPAVKSRERKMRKMWRLCEDF